MRIGNLRHRVTIQAPTYTRGTDGSNLITYSGSTTLFAQVKILGQSEGIVAEKLTSNKSIEVLLRYNIISSTITEKYQLVWEGSTYGITGVINDERLTSITINATEIK
jgi:head-tail adaptor